MYSIKKIITLSLLYSSFTLSNAAFESYIFYNQQTKQTLSVFTLSNQLPQSHLKDILETSFVPYMQSTTPKMYWYFLIESKDESFCNTIEKLMELSIEKVLPPDTPPYEVIAASKGAHKELQKWLTYRFFVYDECKNFFTPRTKENATTLHFVPAIKEVLLSNVNYYFIKERKHLVLIMAYTEEEACSGLKQRNFKQALTEALAPLHFTLGFSTKVPVRAPLSSSHAEEEMKMKKEPIAKCDNPSCITLPFESTFTCSLCKTVVYCSPSCKRTHWRQEHRKKHLLNNSLLFQNAIIFLDNVSLSSPF